MLLLAHTPSLRLLFSIAAGPALVQPFDSLRDLAYLLSPTSSKLTGAYIQTLPQAGPSNQLSLKNTILPDEGKSASKVASLP